MATLGTYLPPLFTKASAEMTASNAIHLQREMDARFSDSFQVPPLLLLETPPLTYFSVGDLAYSDFFSLLTERVPCGLVLDIGHVWTVYRYSGRWRSQTVGKFLDEVLASFPLSRVVQINMAGLANHPNELDSSDDVGSLLPPWIDAHGAKVPQVLFDMLGQVLAHPGLTNLKGVAMEVDTKPIPLIVDEYRRFIERYGWWERQERCDVGWPVVETRSLAREPSSARMAVESIRFMRKCEWPGRSSSIVLGRAAC